MTELQGGLAVSNGFATGKPCIIESIQTPIDRDEVRRYLGYPKKANPKQAIEDTLAHWIGEAEKRATPRAMYCIFSVVETAKRSIRVETTNGVVEFTGAIGEFIGPVDLLAVFIATAGPDVEHLAGDLLRKSDYLGGLIVNAVGSERAESAEQIVIEQLKAFATSSSRAITLPYSPGYCGMALTEQRKVFSVLDHRQIGVALSPDCLMNPLKSVSGIIGLGPSAVTRDGSPCDRCTMHNCNMRR